MSNIRERATSGEDVRVDYQSIERSLAELWKLDPDQPDEQGVTRAALWNVVAHTPTSELHARASETLGRASESVPQRAIVIRADANAAPELSSWISANCHIAGPGKQVCSEEIAIVAGGDRIHRVPPLVQSLLIPDMPVAVWWIGDVPNENEGYVESLLDPADRLIVDSIFFDRPADLELIERMAEKTMTAPSDLNWVRLEECRLAAASLFDPPQMRSRLREIRAVRITASVEDPSYFGQRIEALFFASWLMTQAGQIVDEHGKVEGAPGSIDYSFAFDRIEGVRGIVGIDIEFAGGMKATIARDRQHNVLIAHVGGIAQSPQSVTRAMRTRSDDLIVRQLKRPEPDRVFLRVLPASILLARRITG